jgi:hypothetical protein
LATAKDDDGLGGFGAPSCRCNLESTFRPLLCPYFTIMPVRPPTWALVLLGTIVIWLGTRALWTSGSQIDPTPVPGRSNGEPTFRQRLVAIGDLHGGMSSYWLRRAGEEAYLR